MHYVALSMATGRDGCGATAAARVGDHTTSPIPRNIARRLMRNSTPATSARTNNVTLSLPGESLMRSSTTIGFARWTRVFQITLSFSISMTEGTSAAIAAKTSMAQLSGTDLPGYEAQLKTTKLFYTPKETLDFTVAPALVASNDMVRKFSFDHGLLGQNATSVDVIGIEFPGGKVLGDAKNIKLRFDATYIQLASEGKL